ncbi:MAG TPA: hypothetical protein VLI42_09935, partial [Chthoniobacterales bacterium]|nr:hypothetical protein [Chthoniobacterales bacterium]
LQTGASHVVSLSSVSLEVREAFGAFENVLFARACGLPHLVDGAVAFLEKAVRESGGQVENDLSFLVGEELPGNFRGVGGEERRRKEASVL